jgi:hypothetical protein
MEFGKFCLVRKWEGCSKFGLGMTPERAKDDPQISGMIPGLGEERLKSEERNPQLLLIDAPSIQKSIRFWALFFAALE